MHCNNWIFDMDGTLTDSMTVVWEGAPDALLARYGRTPKSDLHKTLLTMGMADGAAYLIREYDLPLKMEDYNDVMWDVIPKLYETVELKPGGYHLMFQQLKAPLQEGTQVPVTLIFKDSKGEASRLHLELPVYRMAPKAGSHGHSMQHGHGSAHHHGHGSAHHHGQ